MKKYIFIISMILLSVFMIDVSAASVPYNWIVDGKEVNQVNDSNTAVLLKDGNVVTLKLQNYNGGGIKLNCYGTGQAGITFIIELSGENVITDENVGINFNYGGKIEFKGDGSLKINAPKPISYESYTNSMIIKPSENIYSDKIESINENTDVVVENDDVKDTDAVVEDSTINDKDEMAAETIDEKIESKGGSVNIFLITTIVLGVIALIELVYIIVKKNKKA